MLKIKISSDYSKTPGPRYESEGDFSGQRFRDELVYPRFLDALKNEKTLIVDLDGTAGYGTSFLEETFGGLVREYGITYKQIRDHLEIISEDEPYLIPEIIGYIKDEDNKRLPSS